MYREVVYRSFPRSISNRTPDSSPGSDGVNVNDEIGLDSFCSYSLPEYLVDLARYEQRYLVEQSGNRYKFHDGTEFILVQREEEVVLDSLCRETLSLIEGGLLVGV